MLALGAVHVATDARGTGRRLEARGRQTEYLSSASVIGRPPVAPESIGGVIWSTLYAMNSTRSEHECANASRGHTTTPWRFGRLLLITLLTALLATAIARTEPLQASGARQLGRLNTWSARSSTGRVLAGSWTGSVDPKTGAASGSWTLFDANGQAAMRGGWSAIKSAREWTGSWRANVVGSAGEFSGTWRATVDLDLNAPLADLFTLAVQKVVSGSWRVGTNSGSWSIRASASN